MMAELLIKLWERNKILTFRLHLKTNVKLFHKIEWDDYGESIIHIVYTFTISESFVLNPIFESLSILCINGICWYIPIAMCMCWKHFNMFWVPSKKFTIEQRNCQKQSRTTRTWSIFLLIFISQLLILYPH